ncbi:hypothetical protein [Cumulibacter manganitolerans]|uniref:hypothetical protein n=1 Tax=Cumulibacter manganitolerans TaxID=1884992 RepID=UPI0012976570|nr:hypothetical protein [Cumulibacter manganitolerans]
MTEILIGLGQLLAVDADNLAGDLPTTSVRVAGVEATLRSGDDFRVWNALSRAPQPLDSLPSAVVTPDAPGPAELRGAVERLRDAGLVVGVAEGVAHLELAMRIRLLPLWRANTAELATPERYPIGTATTTVLSLTGPQHAVWSILDERNRIADVAVGTAVLAGDDDVERHLPAAWAGCIELVRLGAAYFDVVIA